MQNSLINSSRFFLLIFVFASILTLKAEGTRELAPNANTEINDASGMTVIVNDVEALHIGISDPLNENILLGFSEAHVNGGNNPTTFDFNYRILDPNGNVVFNSETLTPTTVNINNWNEAIEGPSQLVGMSGYDATLVNAADLTSGGWTGAGDYYIEFQNLDGTNAMLIDFWDITVVENSGAGLIEKKGRLWSYNWALFAINDFGFPNRPFNGAFYVCAPDVLDPEAAFITLIDFNNAGFRPAAFNIAFNSFGTLNTGNITSDRRSRENVNSTIPEYAIFLNDPVDICRTAESGEVNILGISRCDAEDYCIKFISTRSGQIDLLLDFDGQDDIFTPGTADVMIAQSVDSTNVGQEVCLPWDGRDGFGNLILEDVASQIPISLSFAQGIYHFPIYDAELMTNGFSISNVRPVGPEPLLFYDDREISVLSGSGEAQAQLMGCDLPCHTWTNYTTGDAIGFGNLNTINSWWFSQQTMNTEVLFLPSFYECNIEGPTVTCEKEEITLELITLFGPDDSNPADINNLNWTGPGIVSGNTSESIIIDASGNYQASFSWENGTGDICETACSFDFEFLESSSFTIDTLLEFNETLDVNSIVYDVEGTFTQILTAANGCDSILTIIVDINIPEVMLSCNLSGATELCEDESGVLNLSILKSPTDAPDPEILDISWTLNGSNIANNVDSIVVTDAGQYTATINYVNLMNDTLSEFCAIIVNVFPTFEMRIDTIIGELDTIDINGFFITSPGQFIDSLTTQEGCDSLIIINVIQESSVLYYNLDDCVSSNYDLFVPEYPTPLECADLDASIVFRMNEELNRHSCTPGIDGGIGLCVSSVDDCNYLAGNERSTIIELLVNPNDQEAVQITSLNFYERAPQEFQWIVGTEGLNNYPTRFGIRVLKNGLEIFRDNDINTSLEWSLQSFNFASLPEFKVQEPSVFRIELLAYCLIGNESDITAWDIDEISLQADCANFVSNKVIVSGLVNNTINKPLENVQMDLKYGEFDFEKTIATSDANGYYAFEDVTKQEDYNLRPVSGNDYLNGVTTLDLIHMQRHILGIESFKSPYKMIAADIDRSKSVTTYDMLELKKLILGLYNEFPRNESWRFIQKDQELHFSNPWNVKENKDLSNIDYDTSQSFIGVKIGDVTEDNSSFVNALDIEKRSAYKSKISVANSKLNTGEKMQLKLNFNDDLSAFGYQLALTGEGISFISVDNNDLIEGVDYVITDEKIIFSVASANESALDDIFITVLPLSNTNVENALYIEKTDLKAELYGEGNSIFNLDLEFESIIEQGPLSIKAYPNPFDLSVQIDFESEENQKSEFVFYDIAGQKILEKTIEVNTGLNQLKFDSSDFGSYNGIIIYEVKLNTKTLSGVMIKN